LHPKGEESFAEQAAQKHSSKSEEAEHRQGCDEKEER
jgi:hypothetical protein